MSDTDAIRALAAIAEAVKDPKYLTKLVAEADRAEQALTAARKTNQEAREHRQAGDVAMEQAKTIQNGVASVQGQITKDRAALSSREKTVSAREVAADHREADQKERENRINAKHSALDARERDLIERERAADEKLEKSNRIMADYDEAKHKAALKLAS